MRYQAVKISELLFDTANSRKTYDGIKELKESIATHGLLQNLVVAETSQGLMVRAGSRRHKALTELVAEGRIPDETVVLVLETNGKFENLVENLQRDKIPAWQIGQRLLELYEAGTTQAMLANKIGWSQGMVSMHIKIAKFLAPSIISRLNALKDKAAVSQSTLVAMSGLYNPDDYSIDEEAQHKKLDRALMVGARGNRGKDTPRVVNEKTRVYSRYRKLKEGKVRIPGRYLGIVDSLIKYLNCETAKLEFDL